MSDPMSDDDRAQAAVAADLLAHSAVVHRLSAAITVLAVTAVPFLALLRPDHLAMAMASLTALAGLAELWFALRAAFDARVFQRMARGDSPDGLTPGRFDAAMSAIGLIQADKAGRPLAPRVRGAMGLLGRQTALLVAQVVLLIAGGWLLLATGGA